MIPGINSSLGSYIGSLARDTDPNDRKSHYFMTCGMNGIIDLSDKSEGSQLSTVKNFIPNILDSFPSPTNNIKFPSEIDKFEVVVSGQQVRKSHTSKYLKKCLEKISAIETRDKLEIIKDSYIFVLKLHRFHQYLFSSKYNQLSEQDYLVKIWSPLIEIMFRSLNEVGPVIAHWGDTTSDQVKDDKKIIRMDLRLISVDPQVKTLGEFL